MNFTKTDTGKENSKYVKESVTKWTQVEGKNNTQTQ